MHSGILLQVIYWSPIPVLAALVVIFLRRRLTRKFPSFFTYVVVTWAKNIAQLVAYWGAAGNYKSSRAYGYTYWFSQLVSAVFMLFATYELTLTHLFPRYHKVSFYRYLFPIAELVVVGFVGFAFYGGSRLGPLVRTVHLMDVLQVLAMFFFVALMQFMGRQWSRYQFAIALGLGINSVGLVIWIVVFLKSSGALPVALYEVPPTANAFAFLVWLIAFLRPERPPAALAAPVSPEVLHQAKQWEEALKESLTQNKSAYAEKPQR